MNTSALYLSIQTGAPTVESSMEIRQKIRNGSALWPSDSTLGILSEEIWNTNLKEHKHPYVHCSVTHNHQDTEALQVSIDEWRKQLWYIYTMEYYSAIKKKDILPFATAWMDLESIMLSKVSQS